jgi:hypothetical protein
MDIVVNGEGKTKIEIAKDLNTQIGDFRGAIDIGDISTLSTDKFPANQQGAIMHEVWEQYEKQVKGLGYDAAHENATKVENKVTKTGINIEKDKPNTGTTITVKSNMGTTIIYFNYSGGVKSITYPTIIP